MPQRRCAIKSLRADKKRKARNSKLNSNLKRAIKSFLSIIQQNKAEEAKASLSKVLATIDKAASQGILHKNNAARKKSQLTKKVNALKK